MAVLTGTALRHEDSLNFSELEIFHLNSVYPVVVRYLTSKLFV